MSENSNSGNAGIGLLVIRANDMDRLAAFYTALGFRFIRHSHPPCGLHYSTTDTDCVFEICERRDGQPPTTDLFFGLNVDCVQNSVESAVASGGTLVRPPQDSEWGCTAIIRDPEGHRLMLTERQQAGDRS